MQLVQVIGTVNGVQGSIQEFFQIAMYLVTLLFTDPGSFWILVTIAIANVVLAAVIYTCWFCSVYDGIEEEAEAKELAIGVEQEFDQLPNQEISPRDRRVSVDVEDSVAGAPRDEKRK